MLFGLLNNDVRDALIGDFAQQRFALHAGLFGGAPGLGQQFESVLAQALKHLVVAAHRGHLDQHREIVHDVQEEQRHLLAAAQRNRFTQPAIGRGATV